MGWAFFMGAFALFCPVGAWMYGRRIAARVLLSADGRVLRVYETTLLGTTEREIALADIELSGVAPGDSAGEGAVASSRIEVEVRGQRSFVIPLSRGAAQRDRILGALRGTR